MNRRHQKPHSLSLSPPSVNEIQLVHNVQSSEDTHTMMRTQYEWLFINMTVINKTVNMFGLKQDVLIYTVSVTGYRTVFEAGMVATLKKKIYCCILDGPANINKAKTFTIKMCSLSLSQLCAYSKDRLSTVHSTELYHRKC